MRSIRSPGTGALRVSATLGAAAIAAVMFLLAVPALSQGPDPDRFIVKFAEGKGQQGRAVLLGANAELLLELGPQNAAAARIPAQALAGLANNPNIEYIERDPPRYPMAETLPYGVPMVQADPYGTDPNRLGPGPHAPKVCIIDSGYDSQHEDLPKHGGVTGYPTGWDTDRCGHGTHVAGTIAALGNDRGVVGILGKGPVGLHIVKVFGDDCSWSYASNLIDASNRCATAGANIISMSLGCSGNRCSSTTENNAFQNHYTNGILSIAAAGNAGNTAKSYPASYTSVISVAAVDSAGVVASFSQKNDAVELAAPGVAVRSTVPMGAGKNESLSVDGAGYEAIAMDGSPNGTVSSKLVDCGFGGTTCTGASGAVCLIQRGNNISFADKVLACEKGLGVAVVIYNNADGLFSGTLGTTVTKIPSVSISLADGAALKKDKLGSSSTVVVGPGNYAYYDGTSMATPHVAGVAALIWTHNPTWTNAQIRNALQSTARDFGAVGRDNSYGYGLVQAAAALHSLGGSTPPPSANVSPMASFTHICSDLGCAFTDTSTDSDGLIASRAWNFGDGNNSTETNPTHTYSAGNTYTVTLVVTDNGGATGTSSQSVKVSSAPATGGIDLTVNAYKVKGLQRADLRWGGATSINVDIFRNNTRIGGSTEPNDGAFTDNIGLKGSGSYTYRVCEAGTNTCSANVTATF